MLRYSPSSSTSCVSVVLRLAPQESCTVRMHLLSNNSVFWILPVLSECDKSIGRRLRTSECLSSHSMETVARAAPVKAACKDHGLTIKSVPPHQCPRMMAALYYSATHYHNWRRNFALEHRDTCSLCHFQAHRHTYKTAPTNRDAPTHSQHTTKTTVFLFPLLWRTEK